MTATAKPAEPAELEQPTQPLPTSALLPPGGGRSAEAGVWLVPATVVAAVGAGTVTRAYFAAEQGFVLLVVLLVGLLVLAGGALVFSRVVDR